MPTNYFCYANGKILKKNDIKVGITDLVMLRGYGAFDYLRTYYGVPFRLNDYLNRFEQSAKGMKLKLPISKKKIAVVINTLLAKNATVFSSLNHRTGQGIRLLLTGGYSLDSYLPSVKPNLFVLIEDLPTYPEWWTKNGIKLMLHEHSREMARVKTVNYITAIHLADQRRRLKVQDTLYCSNGKILETTRNNFFLFHGNTLVTSDNDILQGITRKTVIELANRKFKTEIRSLEINELNGCTECFLTGTTRGITPVVQIDSIRIGNGKVGQNTKELIRMFNELVDKECKRKNVRASGKQ